ncbi:MAG TPA: sialidase family protein [Steroidobacteraceae bacterium]|nr:sialidase family protein [Steroidobacteraceae bacterium]
MRALSARITITLAGLLAAYPSHTQTSESPKPAQRIFETDVTNDLNLSSGEPEIAVDPTDPRNLAIVEFAVGSAEVPTFERNPIMDVKTPQERQSAMASDGRVMLSRDGGNTWTARAPPAHERDHAGGGDPMIAYGPDGTLYVADEPFPKDPAGAPGDMSRYTFVITASRDGGKTFSTPQFVGTPVDRPWLKVDQSTGDVYTVSTGFYDPQTKQLGKPGGGAIRDRWLVAWKPHLAAKSKPRRLGGPDFGVTSGNGLAAAHGIVAATFVLGTEREGPMPAQRGPMPESLEGLLPAGTTTCTPAAPCLFFETSTDKGRHWARHHVPTQGEFAGFFVNVAADPGRRGRFAVLYAIGSGRSSGMGDLGSGNQLAVMVTDDAGITWSAPVIIPETATGKDFKYWMDYGPTGVLGAMWRKERSDLATPRPSSPIPDPMAPYRPWGAPYDIYADISCDGGKTWAAPVRVNAATSPSGYVNQDDFSYIALDAHYAHLVWGDRRMVSKVKNTPLGTGGLQVFYGRVPFSALSGAAACAAQPR